MKIKIRFGTQTPADVTVLKPNAPVKNYKIKTPVNVNVDPKYALLENPQMKMNFANANVKNPNLALLDMNGNKNYANVYLVR